MSMLKSIPVRPRLAQKSTWQFAIVASRYNEEYVQPLVEHARKELKVIDPGCSIKVISVPGAFEIPLMVKTVVEREQYSAILALGVIMQGETEHARFIAQAVTNALLEISLQHRLPIIHEVLLVENESQARARCIDEETNRGIEAARTAASAVRSLLEVK